MDEVQNGHWLNEGRCWICGAFADSAEHFVKASDLRFNWPRGPFAMTPLNQAQVKIQGPKSEQLKYRPSLCKKCNNERTQPSDLAWEEFNKRIQLVAGRKASGGLANLPKLFSNRRWRELMLRVHLYWAKALGCYLAECNERHRAIELREALLKERSCSTLQLIFFSAPVGDEFVLHKTSLNFWNSKNAAFFMYSLNHIVVAPVLSPNPAPHYPRFQHWHPDSLAKSIRLHKLGPGDKNCEYAPSPTAARRDENCAGPSDWWDSGEEQVPNVSA